MQNHTTAAADRATQFARLMVSSGYGMSPELHEALTEEFASAARTDEFHGTGTTSQAALLEALEFAANRMSADLD